MTGRKWTNTTELFIPTTPCTIIIDVGATGIYQCLLPDIPEKGRYLHTQDEFMVCGGEDQEYDCKTLDPVSGLWDLSYTWKEPPRKRHVSWSAPASPPSPAPPTPAGVFLMGGMGNPAMTTTSLLPTPQGSPVVPGFGLVNGAE